MHKNNTLQSLHVQCTTITLFGSKLKLAGHPLNADIEATMTAIVPLN